VGTSGWPSERRTATGSVASGTPEVPDRSTTCPKAQEPPSALASAVTVIVCVAPGASVKLAGVTDSASPFAPAADAVQVTALGAEPSTTRVQVQVVAQASCASVGRFNDVGSPSAAGSAAE
jgi:hypothetical protein